MTLCTHRKTSPRDRLSVMSSFSVVPLLLAVLLMLSPNEMRCDTCSGINDVYTVDDFRSFCAQNCTNVGTLQVEHVANLIDLTGCESIQTVSNLRLKHNPHLASLNGMSSLVQVGDLIISDNKVRQRVCQKKLCSMLSVAERVGQRCMPDQIPFFTDSRNSPTLMV